MIHNDFIAKIEISNVVLYDLYESNLEGSLMMLLKLILKALRQQY